MFTRIWDMSYEVEDDCINIEQDAGCGEVHRVSLHPIHLRLLASEAGLLEGDADAWKRVETLERRMRSLCIRIASLDEQLWAVPVFPPGSDRADPINLYSEATRELAEEWAEDLGLTVADELEATQEPRNAAERQGTQPNAKPNQCQPVTGDGVSQPGLPGLEVSHA